MKPFKVFLFECIMVDDIAPSEKYVKMVERMYANGIENVGAFRNALETYDSLLASGVLSKENETIPVFGHDVREGDHKHLPHVAFQHFTHEQQIFHIISDPRYRAFR